MSELVTFDGGKDAAASGGRVKVWFASGPSGMMLVWDKQAALLDMCYTYFLDDAERVMAIVAGEDQFICPATMPVMVEILEVEYE